MIGYVLNEVIVGGIPQCMLWSDALLDYGSWRLMGGMPWGRELIQNLINGAYCSWACGKSRFCCRAVFLVVTKTQWSSRNNGVQNEGFWGGVLVGYGGLRFRHLVSTKNLNPCAMSIVVWLTTCGGNWCLKYACIYQECGSPVAFHESSKGITFISLFVFNWTGYRNLH